jgi:hypothetical protein
MRSLLFVSTLFFAQVFAAPPSDPTLRTVAILTMPPADNETHLVGHGHYITEMSDIFMRSGGLHAVYLPYNISDTDLDKLLDQVNGVYLTGGDLDLYNEQTGELHPYTLTSIKIIDYARK